MELLFCYIKCSVMKVFMVALDEYSVRIPYSGKRWWEKTLANLAN